MSDLTDHALIIAASAATITAIAPPMIDRAAAYLESTSANLAVIECRIDEQSKPRLPLYTTDP